MSPVKEPNYFIKGSGYEDWEQYLKLFHDAVDKDAIGESSAGYSYRQESPGWIKSVLGDVRVIMLLRNPSHRAFSLYGWMVREGCEDAPTFAEALEREEARMNDPTFRERCPHFFDDYLYFTTGFYYEQVSRYFETFGRDRVKVFLFEEFISHPLTVCHEIFRFLGIDDSFVPEMEIHNKGRIPKSITLQSWLRSRSTGPSRWPVMGSLTGRIAALAMEWNVRLGGKSSPDAELMESLTEAYRDDIKRLEILMGRDLSLWLRKRR